jgi:hypothetical protein
LTLLLGAHKTKENPSFKGNCGSIDLYVHVYAGKVGIASILFYLFMTYNKAVIYTGYK